MIYLRHYICHERLNINILFGTGFVVLHVVLTGHLTCVMLANLSVLLAIDLISDEDLCYVLVRMLVYALQPHLYIFERICIGQIKAENDALRLLVKAEREGAETFLTGRVPYFHLHCAACRAIRRLKALYDIVET